MTEVERIADQLERACAGEAWHGPSLGEVLVGVTAREAAARPVAGAHSIWEIVLHLAAWEGAVRRRLGGDAARLTPEEDWPAASGGGEAAWGQALAALDAERRALHEAVCALSDESLNARVPGKDYSVYFMLQGVIQHNLYHAGQIALLRKMPPAEGR